MIEQNPKFKPLAGQYNLRFKYDEPIYKADGQYGPYWICGVWVENVEHTWFLNDKTNAMIKASGVRKDSRANLVVVQQQGQKGPYNTFELITDGGAYYSHGSTSQAPPQTQQQTAGPGEPPAQGTPPQQQAPPPTEEYTPEVDRDGFTPPTAQDTPDKLFKMETLMDKCLQKAYLMGRQQTMFVPEDFFTSEDIRSIAISMFIQMNK